MLRNPLSALTAVPISYDEFPFADIYTVLVLTVKGTIIFLVEER